MHKTRGHISLCIFLSDCAEGEKQKITYFWPKNCLLEKETDWRSVEFKGHLKGM